MRGTSGFPLNIAYVHARPGGGRQVLEHLPTALTLTSAEGQGSMQQPTSGHPSWCEYPTAPHDRSHTHTVAIGAVLVGDGVTVDAVVTQPAGTPDPTITVHISGPKLAAVITMQGREPWLLAGLMIDATVMLARLSPIPTTAAVPAGGDGAAGYGHPLARFGGRSPGRRRVRRVVRCVRYRDGGLPARGPDAEPSR